MLHVIQSNKTEYLARMLSATIKQKSKAFDVSQILVGSVGMSKWLKINIAEHNNIAAGLEFPFQSSFIWRIFHNLLTNVPRDNDFTKDAMTWKLLQIIPDMLEDPKYQTVANYVNQAELKDLSLYNICYKIADTFDQYLIFRPEWIDAWEQGRQVQCRATQAAMDLQPWQADLWNKLVSYNSEHLGLEKNHRAGLHQKLIAKLQNTSTKEILKFLPERIFVFGLSSIPIKNLEIFHHLSKKIDVFFFNINPCRYYWGDLVNTKYRARALKLYGEKNSLSVNWQEILQVGNPVLANNGKLGREFLDLLFEIPQEEIDISIDAFEEHEEQQLSILQHLQNDLLNLQVRGQQSIKKTFLYESNVNKVAIDPLDSSLQIYKCHSNMREVEVLHDWLLTALHNDPELQLVDILIMAPDISSYAPAIDAVFTNHEHKLRYSISDRGELEENPIIQSFLDLLSINETRFGLSEVMALLEVAAIRARFNLTEVDLSSLRKWLQQAGVRWGRDKEHRASYSLPDFHSNSWDFGIKRMVLGFCMPDNADFFDEHLPLAGMEGQKIQILGGLFEFIEKLDALKNKLSTDNCCLQVIQNLRQIIEDFYHITTPKEEISIKSVNESINYLENQWEKAKYKEVKSIAIVQQFFKQRLSESKVGQNFLVGALNFCTLMPMRAIPFKVICIMGMNAKDYPRQQQNLGFDLMAHTPPQKGDKNRKFEDRYLFLEALLSVRQQLYVSYVGNNIKDNTQLLPSLLLSELLDYCKQSFILSDFKSTADDFNANLQAMQELENKLVINTPMQPFDISNYHKEQQNSRALLSYKSQWFPAVASSKSFIDTKITSEAITNIDAASLYSFYKNPCGYFFNKVLKVYWNEVATPYSDDEPFDLQKLEKYHVKTELLSNQISEDAFSSDLLAANGKLPHAPFSDLFLNKLEREIAPLAQTVKSKLVDKQDKIKIKIELEKYVITDSIDTLVSNLGCLAYHVSNTRGHHLFKLGIKHLLVNAYGLFQDSYLVDAKSIYKFARLQQAQALELVQVAVDYYIKGLTYPLPYHETLWDYCDKVYKKNTDHINALLELADGLKTKQQRLDVPLDPYQTRVFDFPNDYNKKEVQDFIKQLIKPLQELITVKSINKGFF